MVACCWILFVIISTTTATTQISKYLSQRHKDMNITLRSIDEDKSDAEAASDNIQKLVNDVKSKFYRSNQDKPISGYKDTVKFSDFIQEVIELLNKFNDTDLENVFSIANAEIKQHHYKGCKFRELTENLDFGKYIAKALEENRRRTANDIRNHLRTVSEGLKDKHSNKYIKKMIDSINSLYKDESIDKFNKFLTNLDHYRLKTRRDVDLVKIIRAGLRSVIFDYYSNLDHHSRSEFKSKVNDFWTKYIHKSLPLVRNFAKAIMNDVNKSKSKKSTDTIETTKEFKKKNSKLPSLMHKKINAEKKYVTQHDIDAYGRAFQIDDINNSRRPNLKSHKIETSKQSLPIPWEDFEQAYDTIYEPNPLHPSHHPAMEVITMRPYVSKRALTSQKFKYEILFQHDIKEPNLHLKKPEFQIKHKVHIRKPNEPMEIIPPLFSENSVIYLNENIEKTKQFKKATKRIIRLPSITRKHKRVQRSDTVVFKDNTVQNRRNFDNASVIKRLLYLEDALRVAQTQIRNDSVIIKDLNSLLTNQKIDNNVKYKGKPTTEDNKNVVIDLKINFDDLQKIVSVPFNEIKEDEIKNALLKKLNIEDHDNTYSNSSIARKFDFDQRIFNSSALKGKELELSRSKYSNNTDVKDHSSSARGYLTNGDTYERTEERIYASDFIKDKYDMKKRLQKVKNENNHEKVSVSSERRNKKSYQNIHPYITVKNKIEPYIDEKYQHPLSSDHELDENERHGVKRKNKTDSYELNKKLYDKRYTTRLDTDSKQNRNPSNKENENINHDYYLDKKGIEDILNYGLKANNQKDSNYNNSEANNKQNLNVDFTVNKKIEVNLQSNEPLTPTGTLVTTVVATSHKDEIEFKIENENAKFEQTEDRTGLQYGMASPRANEVISTTDIVTQ